MNTLIKAVLLNIFIFPGSGQLLQKRRLRGWLYIGAALLCLMLLFRVIFITVSNLLAEHTQGSLSSDITALTEQVSSALVQSGGAMASYSVIGFLLIWLIALADALICGLKNSRNTNL